MINILYLHAGSEMYGADKVLLELVTGLDKKKFHPIVILPSEGVLAVALRHSKIEVYIVSYPILRRKYFNLRGIVSYTYGYFKATKQIFHIIKNQQINLIHVNTIAVLEGILLKHKLKVPLIWHIHEIITTPKVVYKVTSFLLGKYADQVIAVSGAVKEHLVSSGKINQEKIKIIYNGVDNNVFNPNVTTGYLFDEFNIPHDSLRVGMIGRVNAWKGQTDFLQATAPLLEKYPKLYLILVGGVFAGEEQRMIKLRQIAAQLPNNNRIIISDFRNDTANLHNFFDVFVLPSTRPDPLPTVVLEAMASGKPVIGYRHGGICEMVIEGYNGLLVSPNKSELLQNAVEQVVTSKELRKVMGNNSLQRQDNYFSLSAYISNFSQLYSLLTKIKS
ncbi:glycosyltransferase family 4 protein [Loigolactobacillus backii]|uniref:glycosyltransferase family 4 protein n=1 Tax=Loigolactobacillus backii TaxID=375175 RepID=UPI0022FD5DB5|nr:glycosyltransferase family 4 protein [Loigolactobacillus backii]MDA5388283.1 glycosyltransferase family 4 protein [Loigolactobacillus backii]MDA5390777.1 glycosyltransferase family 4 protein [Loigolactobacillus backii]